MTPEDLKIEERDHAALIQVLGMLERGELVHERTRDKGHSFNPQVPNGFNMECSGTKTACGTVACIGGWVAYLTGRSNEYVNSLEELDCSLQELYWGNTNERTTPDQAASALRNYLTLGEPRWGEVMHRSL
jgi:hypothetical protein